MKKLIKILLICALMLLALSISVSAATSGYYTYTVSNGEATITDVNTSISGAITIPSTLGGYPVTTIGGYAFEDCTKLTSVVIPDSVTTIGSYAFEGCTGLTAVYISDLSAWCNIDFGNYSSNPLYYAKNLYVNNELVTNLVIPDNVTTIGSYAFSDCTGLTSVVIPDSVTTIGSYAFSDCTGLTSVVIPDSVTMIGVYAFYGCTGLTSVVIPDSVTTIGSYAFYNCTGLTAVYISDLAAWCNIDFGDYSSNPLYYAKNLYVNNELVTNLVIPDNVTTIGSYAFRNCTGLTSVVIPDSVTTIGDYAFYNCTNLTSVVIPDSVTAIGGSAFYNCTNLTSVVIPDSVTTIGGSAFYNCTSLTSVVIPDSVTAIGSYAFRNCTGLTSVVIGDSVTTIGNYAFYGCTGLTSVVIGDSVTTIGSDAFYNCTSLTSVVIPDSVTAIGSYAFYNCTGLTSVVIPDSVTTIGYAAFNGCTGLTSVYYRGDSSQWSGITIGSYNSNLTSANRIYNAVKIKAYDMDDVALVDKYIVASKTTFKSLFPDKSGYTRIIYTDNTFTDTIDANSYITEDIEVYVDYVINQYTYKFVDCDGTVIKEVTADYQTVIEKPENPTRDGDAKYSSYTFSKWSGYTEGMKLTKDITFTAVYDTTYNHHIELTGTTSVAVGNTFTEKISMVTLKPVNYLICEIVYPDVLELNSITPKDFKYASKESLKTKDGLNYLTVICQYADDETTVPQNTTINPFNLSFTVSKTAKPQEIEIKFGEDTYLSGEEDYPFENKINAKIEVLPKLATSVTITGNSIIYEPTQFTAEVSPDYTTDKTIEWSVNDETVATISKDGILTPIKNGEVTITATAVGGAYRTKIVTVYRNAYVDGFKSDVGMWNEKILPDTKEYTIYVTEDTDVINITPLFTTGTLKYDNAVVIKNRPKEFELTENETTITFARSDTGYLDCTYTINVIKKTGIKNETILAESFKEDCINILVYNNNVVKIEEVKDITITIPENVKSYKILYWESLATLKPAQYAPIAKEFLD